MPDTRRRVNLESRGTPSALPSSVLGVSNARSKTIYVRQETRRQDLSVSSVIDVGKGRLKQMGRLLLVVLGFSLPRGYCERALFWKGLFERDRVRIRIGVLDCFRWDTGWNHCGVRLLAWRHWTPGGWAICVGVMCTCTE